MLIQSMNLHVYLMILQYNSKTTSILAGKNCDGDVIHVPYVR
jgi:hypothetical protein